MCRARGKNPLAIFRIRGLPAADATQVIAMAWFHRALLLSSIFILGAAVIALRTANTRGEPSSEVTGIAVADSAGRVNARNGRIEAGGKS